MSGLTAKAIEQAKPRATRYEKPDSVSGLYLVVQPSGAKSWALRFRLRTERDGKGQLKAKKLTLGPLAKSDSNSAPKLGEPLSLRQARALATRELEAVHRGNDPTAARRAEKSAARARATAVGTTVDSVMVEFLKRYRGKKTQGIRNSTRLLTATYFGLKPDPAKAGTWKTNGRGALGKWSGKPLASITKGDAIGLINDLKDEGHGVTANRTLTVLKTFFGWCVKNDYLTASPVVVLDAVAGEKPRERTLTDAELAAAWRAADGLGYPFGRLVQMAILTGARRDEIRNAPWEEFELDSASLVLQNGTTWKGPLWTLPAERAKNNNRHLVPLSVAVVGLLSDLPRIDGKGFLFTISGDTPISRLRTAKQLIDKAMLADLRASDPAYVMERWTLHDLRRTFYSGLQSLGFPLDVVDACVNHRESIRGSSKHYAHHAYLAEKTAAFDAWARHVESLVKGQGS